MIKNLVLASVIVAAVTLAAGVSHAIDAPPETVDLRSGVEPLAKQFDAETGQHRLLVLLSPA